jgi:hypothetical protein
MVNEIIMELHSLLRAYLWTTHKFHEFVPNTQKYYTWAHKTEHSWYCQEKPCVYHN